VVEGATPTRATQEHLDRCLTCRNCETTCPSGVQYGRLVDVGRKLVDQQVERPFKERATRAVLRNLLTTRAVFEPAMAMGKMLKPLADALLPTAISSKIPVSRAVGTIPSAQHAQKVLLLRGCVQPGMLPSIDAATMRVLDKLGVQSVIEQRSGCCGAINQHLNAHESALNDARRNIDAWWPHVQSGVQAIVMNASGCGAMVKEYAHLLRHDTHYATKAEQIVALTLDLAEYLPKFQTQLLALARPSAFAPKVAFHPPCTLQHGQQVNGRVEDLLSAMGAQVMPVAQSHLCCGSAGTYSVLQPKLSKQLRDNKLADLQATAPELLLSANIGCITHLQSGTPTPVLHWVEWLDRVLG
jgi:glycolate oxidase iron-sulfur subunit